MKWLNERDLAEPGARLFCLPHAGSGAAGYYRWKRVMGEGVAVCPVMLPGRESRLGEPLLTSVAAIVDGLHREARGLLERPYAVFGHSMSALIAYEWVRRIEAEGLRRPAVLFVSGRDGPEAGASQRQLHKLEDEAMVRGLSTVYGGEVEMLLSEPELREVFVPIVRADVTVVETYEFAPGPKLGCNVQAYAGVEDGSVSAEGLQRWGGLTKGVFGARRFEGDHFFVFGKGQGELLEELRRGIGDKA